QVRAVVRLDAANIRDDIWSKTLERTPFQTLRPVGRDVLRRGVEAVRHGTARRLRPKARPEIVGAPAKQQIEGFPMHREDCISASGAAIWCRPVAVGVIGVLARAANLDDAVQRHVFENSELSHCEPPWLRDDSLSFWPSRTMTSRLGNKIP